MNQKNILILTEDVGKSAPGIVFERLISEISSRHNVDLLCLKYEPLKMVHQPRNIWIFDGSNRLFKFFVNPKVKYRISKYSLKFFGNDVGTRLISILMWKFFGSEIKKSNKYDCTISLVSSRHVALLPLAEKIKKKNLSIKNIAYFVDAIPAPLGWSNDDNEFRGTKKFISKRINFLDALFSSNEKMLNYQLTTVKGHVPDCRGVVFTPNSGIKQVLPPIDHKRYNFLYTGGVYGKRTAEHVLYALKLVLRVHPNAYIIFVGSVFKASDFSMLSDLEKTHVEVHPFTQDLTQFYSEATALLDIDADSNNDVFLSSKVINYLTLNRVIISETGQNSPARDLLSGLKSVLQCFHDPKQIAECMCEAIRTATSVDFSDRDVLLNFLSVKASVNALEAAF